MADRGVWSYRLPPNAYEQAIHLYNTARAAGATPNNALFLVGSAYQESGFNPYRVGDGGSSQGLMQVGNGLWSQWHNSGVDVSSPAEQMRAYVEQLQRMAPGTWDAMQNASNVQGVYSALHADRDFRMGIPGSRFAYSDQISGLLNHDGLPNSADYRPGAVPSFPDEGFPLGGSLGFPQASFPPLDFGDAFNLNPSPFSLPGNQASDWGFVDPSQYLMNGASQGGNAISGFGGGSNIGPEISAFNDYGWRPANYGSPGSSGSPSQGGNIFGGDFNFGNDIPSYNDFGWTPVDYSSGGSLSQGGNMEFGGYGAPHWSGDLFDPNIYAGGSDGEAISSFGGLNDPNGFDITGGQSLGYTAGPGLNYASGPDGSRYVYDADWNWLGQQTNEAQGQGQGQQQSGPYGYLHNLDGIQFGGNLSDRPSYGGGIPSHPFGPGQTSSYVNAQGEIVRPSGTGYGYSPSAVYNSAGQYMGANSANMGYGAGIGTNIGNIFGSANSWNTMNTHGGAVTGNNSLGGNEPAGGKGGEVVIPYNKWTGGQMTMRGTNAGARGTHQGGF